MIKKVVFRWLITTSNVDPDKNPDLADLNSVLD